MSNHLPSVAFPLQTLSMGSLPTMCVFFCEINPQDLRNVPSAVPDYSADAFGATMDELLTQSLFWRTSLV